MASMMLCFDVFSSLSMSLSMASRLAMQTSHSFGSALALAASAVASSASASNIRRSIVLGGESLMQGCTGLGCTAMSQWAASHFFAASVWATLGCKLMRSQQFHSAGRYARVSVATTLLLHSVKRVQLAYLQNSAWRSWFDNPSVSMNASLQNAARAKERARD